MINEMFETNPSLTPNTDGAGDPTGHRTVLVMRKFADQPRSEPRSSPAWIMANRGAPRATADGQVRFESPMGGSTLLRRTR